MKRTKKTKLTIEQKLAILSIDLDSLPAQKITMFAGFLRSIVGNGLTDFIKECLLSEDETLLIAQALTTVPELPLKTKVQLLRDFIKEPGWQSIAERYSIDKEIIQKFINKMYDY